MFSRKGAYARFKEFLVRKHLLDAWYEFQNKAEEDALRDWCKQNGVELSD